MQHIVEYVQRGDVRKSSFAFRCHQDDWSWTSEGNPLRTLITGATVDVAPVFEPAYIDTTAGLRSLASHFDADFDEVRSMAEARELRRLFTRSDPQRVTARPRITGPQALMAMMEKRYPDLAGTPAE
jgi:phage head maturation protease